MKALLILLAWPLLAQQTVVIVPSQLDHYLASASTTAMTIQQPTTNQRQITFGDSLIVGASVYCLTASTATLSWNGTAATSTAGTELKLPGTVNASGVTVWTASNVGPGTTGPVFQVPAATTIAIALNWFVLSRTTSTTNITITTNNTCTITFAYSAF